MKTSITCHSTVVFIQIRIFILGLSTIKYQVYQMIKFNWKGCDSGSYGADCKYICGNCLNESDCSNINGTCFTGCNAGYEGDLCKKRE